jgi:hypothetical protein
MGVEWGRGELHTKFQLDVLKGTARLGGLGVDGWIILKWILKKKSVDSIQIVQVRDHWLVLVHTIMNLRFS